MSEERLQEIKDSINLQYKVQEANDLNNFNIFTDEEQELVEEIERLNNIINELKKENEQLQQQCKKQKEVINSAIEYVEHRIVEDDYMLRVDTDMVQKELLDILKEVSE